MTSVYLLLAHEIMLLVHRYGAAKQPREQRQGSEEAGEGSGKRAVNTSDTKFLCVRERKRRTSAYSGCQLLFCCCCWYHGEVSPARTGNVSQAPAVEKVSLQTRVWNCCLFLSLSLCFFVCDLLSPREDASAPDGDFLARGSAYGDSVCYTNSSRRSSFGISPSPLPSLQSSSAGTSPSLAASASSVCGWARVHGQT